MATVLATTAAGREIRREADGRIMVQPAGDNYWTEAESVEAAQAIACPPASDARRAEVVRLIGEDVAAAQAALPGNPVYAADRLRRVRGLLRELES